MKKIAAVMLMLVLAAEAVLTAFAAVRAERTSQEIGSALSEKTELTDAVEKGKETVAMLEHELEELGHRYAWAKEIYDIWIREDREIEELTGS